MTGKEIANLVEDMGKSECIKLTLGFLVTFGRLYLDVVNERFSAILCSYDAKSVRKLFKETKPYIEKGVELFNSKYIHAPLITDKENNRLENNMAKIEINRMVDDEELSYSQIFAITAGTTNDSLTANIIIAKQNIGIHNRNIMSKVA
jgi:hypothetical protein